MVKFIKVVLFSLFLFLETLRGSTFKQHAKKTSPVLESLFCGCPDVWEKASSQEKHALPETSKD